jgi:hypothetical protein
MMSLLAQRRKSHAQTDVSLESRLASSHGAIPTIYLFSLRLTGASGCPQARREPMYRPNRAYTDVLA